ncbi:MAG: hypothetical protein JST93_17565 [Acidobacteria bacterium]|nr:hypothetical protein [Acidobacteriota bacterium]
MKHSVYLLPLALTLGLSPATALVIDFEDLTTRDNFFDQGISNNYQGYVWSTALSGPAAGSTGWASATVTDPAVDPAPTPVSGSSYAWNWSGPQSIFIHFGAATTFNSVWLATLSSAFGGNASTVQLFGYDASDTLVATGSVLSLTDNFQLYSANFTGVYKVEFRADTAAWFSIDDITVDEADIPEPNAGILLAIGSIAIVGWNRIRSKS